MVIDRRRIQLLASAAAIRLVLFLAFPLLPEFLDGRVEISTPVTSFKRLREGVFLYTHGVSPYDGGVFYQAPILLSLLSLLQGSSLSITAPTLYVLLDLFTAYELMRIADSKLSGNERLFKSPRRSHRWPALAIGTAYLFNPFTLLTCLGQSTAAFTNCAIVVAVSSAVLNRPLNSMIALSIASYLSFYPALLLPPMVLICYDVGVSGNARSPKLSSSPAITSLTFLSSTMLLLSLSFVTMGFSWEFLASTYGNHILMTDLTPNIGLWWYFFIEMFDPFRGFFIGVFWLHLGAYISGLIIRIRPQPLFCLVTMLGIFTIFKPYPSVSDASLYLGMLPLYYHILPLTRYIFFATAALLYSSLLGPAFHYLWIYAGSGNANFFYAITLVWSLGLTVIVADSVWATLRDEWEAERPEMKGRFVKQI